MKYHYPGAGGLPAPLGCQLIILTAGGATILGRWCAGGDFLAWALLPERCIELEDWVRDGELLRALGVE